MKNTEVRSSVARLIQQNRALEALVKGLRDWIYDHPDSGLILLLMNVTANAINVNQMLTALKVVETCISAYFLSGSLTFPFLFLYE